MDFYYPYSFIRTPDRKAVLKNTFVDDYDPSLSAKHENHSRYWPERYNGEIIVKLRTETPLLIIDPDSKRDVNGIDGHFSYGCFSEIPASSLKGMLSSAYEIITNSRYRVFSKEQHDVKLEYRSLVTRKKEKYKASPWECLPESLRPADNITQLSPADRLFGWINKGGNGAWKGKLRISLGKYIGEGSPLEDIGGENGLPMVTLGGAHPSQARFYCGDEQGKAQKDGLSREEAGYTDKKRLRGRKVYLYRRDDNKSVMPFYEDKNDMRGKTNISVRSWIPAGKEFEFTIRFENITSEEAGALLVLMIIGNLKGKPCLFRLGYAKPLGLGCVKLSSGKNKIRIFSGQSIKQRYTKLGSIQQTPLTLDERNKLIDIFYAAIDKTYKNKEVDTVLDGFIAAGQGVDGMIAYGVIDGKPLIESFKWFQENEKNGRRKSLPTLGGTLPDYPSKKHYARR